jgi:hypothetical protein
MYYLGYGTESVGDIIGVLMTFLDATGYGIDIRVLVHTMCKILIAAVVLNHRIKNKGKKDARKVFGDSCFNALSGGLWELLIVRTEF